MSTTRFVPACARCAQAPCAQVPDAQGGFRKLRKPPCVRPWNMQSRAYVCGRKPMAIKYHTINLLFFKGSVAVIKANFILLEHKQEATAPERAVECCVVAVLPVVWLLERVSVAVRVRGETYGHEDPSRVLLAFLPQRRHLARACGFFDR